MTSLLHDATDPNRVISYYQITDDEILAALMSETVTINGPESVHANYRHIYKLKFDGAHFQMDMKISCRADGTGEPYTVATVTAHEKDLRLIRFV